MALAILLFKILTFLITRMDWTVSKIKQLPTKNGFYLRGNDMSRIETFVAASFAFLMTMIMVAGNDIPKNIEGFKLAILYIPAFIICAVQIIWIWYEHATWSRRYGLEDAWTIVLSGLLVVIILIYIYPLKAMAAGFFTWVSDDIFPSSLKINSQSDIRFLFIFFSIGFAALATTFCLMNRLVIKKAESLMLTEWELYQTKTELYAWLVMLGTAITSVLLACILNGPAMSLAGMIYSSFGITITLLHHKRAKKAPAISYY